MLISKLTTSVYYSIITENKNNTPISILCKIQLNWLMFNDLSGDIIYALLLFIPSWWQVIHARNVTQCSSDKPQKESLNQYKYKLGHPCCLPGNLNMPVKCGIGNVKISGSIEYWPLARQNWLYSCRHGCPMVSNARS